MIYAAAAQVLRTTSHLYYLPRAAAGAGDGTVCGRGVSNSITTSQDKDKKNSAYVLTEQLNPWSPLRPARCGHGVAGSPGRYEAAIYCLTCTWPSLLPASCPGLLGPRQIMRPGHEPPINMDIEYASLCPLFSIKRYRYLDIYLGSVVRAEGEVEVVPEVMSASTAALLSISRHGFCRGEVFLHLCCTGCWCWLVLEKVPSEGS